MGRPGQAPKQAAAPRLLPRLEFPDTSFIALIQTPAGPRWSGPSRLLCVLSGIQLARGGGAGHPMDAGAPASPPPLSIQPALVQQLSST